MNASTGAFGENLEQAVSYRRLSTGDSTPSRSKRANFGRRRGKGPQQFNGIHRRRKKKIRW